MDWIRETFSAINAIKQWRRRRRTRTTTRGGTKEKEEEKEEEGGVGGEKKRGRLLKVIEYPELFYNNNNNGNDDGNSNDDDDDEKFFVVHQITNELYLMTLKDEETKEIYDKVFVKQNNNNNESIQLNLNANDIERVFVVYITPMDSLIIAKFSSNIYIHIYAQHVFNNAIDIIYLVFITKQVDTLFQIMLSYQKMGFKTDMITTPPITTTNLQTLCLSKIIKDDLYQWQKKKERFPARILRHCQKLKKIIEEFFEHAEKFYKIGWSLRYEPSFLNGCDFLYSKLPEKFDSERGLICHFPRISHRLFQRKVLY